MRIKSRASVIVVESATEASHYPFHGWESLLSGLSHVNFLRKSEADLRGVIADLENTRPSALLIREGAMQLPFVREIIMNSESALQRYIGDGGVFLVMVTALNSEEFVFSPNRQIEGSVRVFRRAEGAVSVRAEWLARTPREHLGDDILSYSTWGQTALDPNLTSRTLIECHFETAGVITPEPACVEIPVGWGKFIVCTIQLPQDSEASIGESVIERLMAHIVREDTFLSMREAGLQERFRRGERGHPNSAVIFADDQQEFQSLSRFANHLYVTDSWLADHWEETSDLIARLLNNGSVRIVHTNTEPNLESILAGPPDYYLFVESVAMDLRSFVHTLASGTTFSMLAFSFLVSEVSSMGLSEQWVPDIFQREYAAGIVRSALRVRVENGSVDRHFLASFNLYAASRLLGVEDKAVDDLEKWLINPDKAPRDDFVAQAHFVARLTGVRSDFLPPVPESSPLSHIGLLGTTLDPRDVANRQALDAGFPAATGLEKILTLLVLQRNHLPFSPEQTDFMESFYAKRRVETLEAFCYHSALLLRHLADLPIRPIQPSPPSGVPSSQDGVSEREANLRVGITALENKLAMAKESAEREHASLLRVAQGTFRFLLVLLFPLQVLVLGAPWLAFASGWLDLTAALTFTGSAVVLLSLLWVYVLRRPEVQKVAPRAIVSVGNFLRGIRNQ
jgi:hypothetical protein